ncbi:MAE_28990/MAE_18760 family HEPN-like nuclease [Paludibacterium denitrificans]|uniref:RiboL-PSP-HEPN domain-containing protein n=1 Tax=Paludibacterium denitrificans TaxID=2675226 RepID=A0A844GCR7_9NEIS|nr:MAE_28990/MAE_18760 family HEPN-like nuclease [Paludibacterium denitrificans]MTD33439.1 hypothetical protein [Paludibacterium denitrificans]
MARFTAAYSSFIVRLAEVEILRHSAAQKERKDPISLRNEINALSRGAIILLSSHLEAYVKELGELAIDSLTKNNILRSGLSDSFFYHISKDFIDEIKDTAEPEKISGKIFEFLASDHVLWSKSGPFPIQIPSERFNKGFSNPSYQKIKAYFNRFGYSSFQHDLSAHLRGDYLSVVNMINHLVDIRNKIAHGDPTATKTPQEVRDIVMFVRRFCQVTDSIFAAWWRSNFCSIR